MTIDFDSYRTSVLDAARRNGNTPPPDLFGRYYLDPRQTHRPDEFAQHVEAVAKYWRSLKLQRKYAPLATALLAAHSDLQRKDLLNPDAFGRQWDEGRTRARTRLDEKIAAIAAVAPCVTLPALRRLVEAMGGAFDEQDIRAALKEQNVAIVDPPWQLPSQPPFPSARSLRGHLTTLGYKLSVETVFGADAVRAGFHLEAGFRLAANGQTVTRETLDEARGVQSRSKQDERKTAADSVLAILATAVDNPELLHRLFLWEVCERLRPDVQAGLPARFVAHAATDLGLDSAEFMKLAATLASVADDNGGGGDGGSDADNAQLALDALHAGDLQEARRLVEALPAGAAPEVRARVEAALRRLADLVRAADAAQAGGAAEEAARLLAEAAELARDDDTLLARLAAIPPPPPGDVRVGVDTDAGDGPGAGGDAGGAGGGSGAGGGGDGGPGGGAGGERVTVSWTPSPARTTGVRYRVVRTPGAPAVAANAGTTVVETQGNEAVDTAPPAAEATYYTIFASRGGDVWSAGAPGGPIELLPDVTDVVLQSDERSVSGSWRADPAAAEVVVTRTSRSSPDAAPHRVPVGPGGASTFVDTGLVTGTTYDYAFHTLYMTRAGARRTSPGVVVSATPEAPPAAVTDLAYELVHRQGTAVVSVSWTPPPGGVVEIRSAAAEPNWPKGENLSRQAVAGYGEVLRNPATIGPDGRARTSMPARHGRVFLTAVTLGGARALIGSTVVVSLVEPVRELRAERLDDVVRLGWVWPEGANLARVRWWPANADDPQLVADQVEVSLRVYTDTGGVKIHVTPGPVTIAVQTVARNRGGEVVSPPETTTVAGRRTLVSYSIRASGFFGRRALSVEVTCDSGCQLPALVVVHRPDGILPLRRDSGRVVDRLAPRTVEPGHAVSIPLKVRVRELTGLACFVDPDAPPAGDVTLVRTHVR